MPIFGEYPGNVDRMATIGSFTEFAPVTPDIFWNVYSEEQRYKYLCEWLRSLQSAHEDLSSQVSELSARVQALINSYNDDVAPLDERVSALEKALETLVTSMLVYDPTKGYFTGSIDQSRRMLQILGNPSADNLTVEVIASREATVTDFAKHMCGEYVNQAFQRMAGRYMPVQEVS